MFGVSGGLFLCAEGVVRHQDAPDPTYNMVWAMVFAMTGQADCCMVVHLLMGFCSILHIPRGRGQAPRPIGQDGPVENILSQ